METKKLAKLVAKYRCEFCDYTTCKKYNYEIHFKTAKHNGNILDDKKLAEKMAFYECKKCDYITSKKSHYEAHLLTQRHIGHQNRNTKSGGKCKFCNKEYSSRGGLWKHMKKCEKEKEEKDKDLGKQIITKPKQTMADIFTPELVLLLIEQNKELQSMIMEQNKETKNIFISQSNAMIEQNKAVIEIAKNAGNNHHNNTINDNKSFNLNFFLNERCKNAMNLSDFVNGVDISLDDFEETGKIGYVEGLSRIFCKELQKLDIYERPIHCSDLKRETIYIRENNRWEKDENKEKLLRAVKQIGKKNIKVLTLWQEKYPGYKDVESKENDRYLHILTNIMCGETEEEIQSNYGKIMKNISRITVVDKK
jgi:hypothetical protein